MKLSLTKIIEMRRSHFIWFFGMNKNAVGSPLYKDRRYSGFMKSRYCIDKEKCDVENEKKRLQKRPIISFHIEPFLTCIYLLFFFGWKYTIKCMFFNQTLNMNGILIPNPYCTTNTCTIYRVITIQCPGSMCVPPVCSLETELMCCCCCRMHSNYMFIYGCGGTNWSE